MWSAIATAELSVGAVTEGVEVKSVGNTPVLKETALIEAFNLKAAIEYVMKNPEATRRRSRCLLGRRRS